MSEVEDLLKKADATLGDAEKAYTEEMLVSTIQNRIYYAVFYAAQAALISYGENPGSHQGTKIKLGQKLVNNGVLDRKRGRFFAQQQTYREQADYQIDVGIERPDLKQYLENAADFISEMRRIKEERE